MSTTHAIRNVLNAAVLVLFLAAVPVEAFAQGYGSSPPRSRQSRMPASEQRDSGEKEKEKYPDATREEPGTKATRKFEDELEDLFEAYNADDAAKVVPLADQIIADEDANSYERAISARLAAAVLIGSDDAKAQDYLRKVLEINGLNNNDHYDSMLLLAQLQLQEGNDQQGLATLDKLIAETKTRDPKTFAIKGNALYQLERYPEAVAALQQAIAAAGDEADPAWQQLLMASYFDMDKPEEALKIAEGQLAKNPEDKRTQLNLAAIYMQAGQDDKAMAMLEKLRAAGQLTENSGYRNLYALYMNTEGKEEKAIDVIKEGMAKGILKPDYQTWVALAQAYYFTDQIGPAIENYRKAAPLDSDGETYLNLAKLLWGEDRLDEAKQAAQQALDKGLKNPEDAKKILAQKG